MSLRRRPSIPAAPNSKGSALPTPELTPKFLRLERSIRALSTAIYIIQQQSNFHAHDNLDSCIKDKDRSKVFGHLATLLTTGSPLGRQTVAVTGGSSHLGFYVNVTEIIARKGWTERSKGPGLVKLSPVPPSGKTLKQLAEDRRPFSKITLAEHAGDVFQALRLVNQDFYDPATRTLECFIVRRCHREIYQRLQSAVELLNPPLHDVLNKWELSSVEGVHEQWLAIPFPPILIDDFSIPHRPAAQWPGHIELLFNLVTFERWKKFFVSLLRVVIDTVTGLHPEHSSSATDAVLALHFLRLFLYFGPARDILTVPSLKMRLENLLPRHKLECNGQQDTSSIDTILRSWRTVVAYDVAVSALTSPHCTVSSILRQFLPKVHVIETCLATPMKSMDSIPRIMRTRVIPALKLSKYYTGVVETLLSLHLSVNEFPGAVHCEASMMGIAYAFSQGEYGVGDPGVTRSGTAAFLDAFEGHSNTIGIAEQSCRLCYWLSEELSLPNGYFTLQSSHGRTVPWTPPRFGIPLSVLANLEVELLELLILSTQRWLEKKTRWPQEINNRNGLM
ncbi:hypothetical protein C8F04DRAFT_1361599 [Mycena alexandri]|uniref:Uncharacterized protein n=1 Tax=Mycena alexandri TaxID=1745969 RepID=A0AAD6XG34_9AGAR|nr:hypothetical protein C8F04DRAFT_1361599 [Mycena alexandri]